VSHGFFPFSLYQQATAHTPPSRSRPGLTRSLPRSVLFSPNLRFSALPSEPLGDRVSPGGLTIVISADALSSAQFGFRMLERVICSLICFSCQVFVLIRSVPFHFSSEFWDWVWCFSSFLPFFLHADREVSVSSRRDWAHFSPPPFWETSVFGIPKVSEMGALHVLCS